MTYRTASKDAEQSTEILEHGKENTTSNHRNKTAQVKQINSTSQNSTGIGA